MSFRFTDRFQTSLRDLFSDKPGNEQLIGLLENRDVELERFLQGPTAWKAPTFENSWVNSGGGNQVAQYRKAGDIVHIRGLIASGTIGTAFTLPVGFRPPATVHFVTAANAAFGHFRVATSGAILVDSGSNVWYAVNCQFSVTP